LKGDEDMTIEIEDKNTEQMKLMDPVGTALISIGLGFGAALVFNGVSRLVYMWKK